MIDKNRVIRIGSFGLLTAIALGGAGQLGAESSARAAVLINADFENGMSGFVAVTGAGPAAMVQIVDAGSKVLQLTDNTTEAAVPRAYAGFSSAMSTTGTGNSQLTGRMDVLFPSIQNAASVIIGVGTQHTTSGGSTAIQLEITGNASGFVLAVKDGVNAHASTYTFSANSWYRLYITGDFSNGSQDTWGIRISSAEQPEGSLFELTGLKTRAANVAPSLLTIIAGNKDSYVSAQPLIQVDNVVFDAVAVPEAASAGLLVPGALMLLRKK